MTYEEQDAQVAASIMGEPMPHYTPAHNDFSPGFNWYHTCCPNKWSPMDFHSSDVECRRMRQRIKELGKAEAFAKAITMQHHTGVRSDVASEVWDCTGAMFLFALIDATPQQQVQAALTVFGVNDN